MERDARAGRSTDEAAGACERPFVASPVNRAAVPRVDDDGRVLAHHGGRKRGVGYLHNGLRRRYRGYPHAELPHHGRLGFDGGHAVPAYVACGGSRWRASLSPRRVRAPDASVCVAICRPYTPSATGINCTALSGDNNADWPLTASGDYTSGTCIAGWTGSPNRQCGLDGVFGAVTNDDVRELKDINAREFLMLALLALSVLAMGIYPKPLTDVMGPSVAQLLDQVSHTKIPTP